MIKYLLSLFLIIFMISNANAQITFWNTVAEKDLKVNQDDIIEYDMILKQANYFSFNKNALMSHLDSAPYREDSSASHVELALPNQDGSIEIYDIFKTKTLAPELAQNYPKIQSYIGKRSDNGKVNILRLTITPQGIYAMIKKPDVGQFFINPYDKNADYYVSFLKKNAVDITDFSCDVNPSDGFDEDHSDEVYTDSDYETFEVDDSTLRTYDLALACTGDYAQFHINEAGLSGGTTAEQTAAVLAAMVVTIDRVNTLYEIDLGVSLQLIPNNDQLIYLNPASDPYSTFFNLPSENQGVVDSTIGSANYDVGHVFSTEFGGFAPGQVCLNGQKAGGATGLPNPVGDPFDVDFAAHEFGHQFGADHTFNNFCQGARFNQTAMEPGSGNTIMGYAGICPPNVQSNSDANFHQVSILQIFNYISSGSGSSCGNFVAQSNTAPNIASLPPSYTIPNGTAFYLDASAVDAEGDPLTYSWEQFDNGISPSQPPQPTFTLGPNFRSFPPTTASKRYFPSFEQVLSNNLIPTWEVIPSVARSMEFVVTVRDNNLSVGQSARAFVDVNFASVGPFQVTSQNTENINWLPGETKTITWDVAGTTANGINTSNVNILLSTDGGITFNTTLASSTPNDGSHDIVVPNVQAAFCRIMVEADGNIFYALNPNTFAIDTNVSTTCDQYANNAPSVIPDGNGTPNSPSAGTPVFSSITIPDDIQNITDINININATHDSVDEILLQLLNSGSDFSNLWIGNCSGQATIDLTFNDSGGALPNPGSTSCGNPITGVYAPFDTDTSIADIFAPGTQGTFTLAAVDFVTGNTGSINSWEIEICSTTFSTEDNQINNFSIAPNPNNGLFNLNLTQPINNNSVISLYDIQGRLMEKLDFNPNLSTQQIQLKNQYQSGVYLIEVANREGKFIQKLVIK